jgi:glycosyltransferase involved in cell wall biosynthesis
MEKINKKLVSIVAPCFNEEEVISKFYTNLIEVIDCENKYNFEILFINDGSQDNTEDVITKLAQNDQRIILINLSRNFGHQNALTCGMDYATGDAVITIDVDLQHPTSLIPLLISQYELGYDIVYTKRKDNENVGKFKKLSAKLFYSLLKKISYLNIDHNVPDFRLITKKVQTVFKNDLRERSRFLRGLIAWVGFKTVAIPFDVELRGGGVTKYKLKNMLKFSASGIISFSDLPLKIGIIFGVFSFLVLIIYAIYILIQFLVFKDTITGWASLALLISFIGSIQFILLGFIGIYIGCIFSEIKNRPMYIVDTITKSKKN